MSTSFAPPLLRAGGAALLALCSACGGSSAPTGPATAPVIASAPASVVAAVGSSATFSISASGSAPLAYQWKRNGSDIAGATSPSYVIAAAALSDTRSRYSVAVRNAAGTAVSNEASLLVTGIGVFAGSVEKAGMVNAAGTAARFSAPRGLVFDKTGNLLVSDFRNGEVRRITPAAVVSTAATIEPTSTPWGITIDKDGNMVVVTGMSVTRFDSAGKPSVLAKVPTGTGDGRSMALFLPTGVAFDGAGMLYITNGVGTRKVSPDGAVTIVEGVDTAESWGTRNIYPRALAADSSGTVWVAGLNGGISKIDGSGQLVPFVGIGEPETPGAMTQLRPAMVFGPGGNLFLLYGTTIRKITPAGVMSTVAGVDGQSGLVTGALPGKLGEMSGIAIDAFGDLYVSYGDAILKVQLPPQ